MLGLIDAAHNFLKRGFKGFCDEDVYWTERRLIKLIRDWMIELKKMHDESHYRSSEEAERRWLHAIRCLELCDDEDELWDIFYPGLKDCGIDEETLDDGSFSYSLNDEWFKASLDIDVKMDKLRARGLEILAKDMYHWTL